MTIGQIIQTIYVLLSLLQPCKRSKCQFKGALRANIIYECATKSAAVSACDRLRSFVNAGAKLFYLSGIRNGKYLQREILNLARFISVMKFRPLSWRLTHPYLLTDRFEVPLSLPIMNRVFAASAVRHCWGIAEAPIMNAATRLQIFHGLRYFSAPTWCI